MLGCGCISHCALCWVHAKGGKSQKKDLMVPVPRGCRDGSSAVTRELVALLLHSLPTPPSTDASPSFLILLVPAHLSLIPCWVPFKPHCDPDIGSMWSARLWDRSCSPGHCCGLRDTFPPRGDTRMDQRAIDTCSWWNVGSSRKVKDIWESSGEPSQGSKEACMH